MRCRPRRLARPRRRREMLLRCANGFGAVALAALLRRPGVRPRPERARGDGPLAPRPPHFPARARSVIFLYMDGGPSQVDTFDPKPRLDREHGQPIKVKTQPTQFNNVGNVLKSPWKFRQYGAERHPGQRPVPARRRPASTTWRSSARWSSNFSEHTNANYFLHTGTGSRAGRAWARGSPTGWAARARTCRLRRPQQRPDPARRASTTSTAASCPPSYQGSVFSAAPRRWPTSSRAESRPTAPAQQARR